MRISKYTLTTVALLSVQMSLAESKLDPLIIESNIFNNHSNSSYSTPVKVLNREDIEKKNTTTLGEAINYEPGISSSYFAPGTSRPIIRGQNNHRILLMENGADIADVSDISADHTVSIETINADRIEILRGPATLRYGPGAVGGIINVINHRIPQTLHEQPLNLNVQLDHATVSNAETAAAEINGSIDNFSWHFDAMTRNSDDYDIKGYADEDEREDKGKLVNSDVDTDNYAIGGSIINENYLFGLSFSKLDSDYGLPGGHGHHEGEVENEHEEADIRVDQKQKRYDAHLEWFQPFANIESILLRSTFNDYRHHELEGDGGEIATTFNNESWDTRLEFVQHFNEQQHNAFGLHYIDKEFSSLGEEAFIQPVDEDRIGIFAITKNTFSQWDIELGARYDHTDYDAETGRDKDFSTASISIGLINYVNEDTEISFSAGLSERAPHNAALYAEGAHLATATYETGNINLDHETSYHFDIGIHRQTQLFDWQLNAFYNYIDKYIYLANTDQNNDGIADLVDEDGALAVDGELTNGLYSNHDAYFYGFEGQLNANLFSTTHTQYDARLFADYVRAKFDDGLGNVPRISPARLGVTLSAQYDQWNAEIDNIFVSKQTKTARLETNTDSYFMMNARLSRTLRLDNTDVKFFIHAENLLDDDARQHTSLKKDTVPLPGRNINLGISFRY